MDCLKIRRDFPLLNEKVNRDKLIYLDSGATAQKPKQVIDEISKYYEKFNANPHRGAYRLSVEATKAYEQSRETVKDFINADSTKEIIFTKNATEGFNLLATSYGMNVVNAGDEIVISIMEHHSNLIPWQRVASVKKANLKYMYTNDSGELELNEIKKKITDKTRIVSITHVSNVLGTINPIKEIIQYAHLMGAIVIVDASQSAPHMKIDVKNLDADFLVFTGHKMMGPMGIGVLYGKEKYLEKMPPYLFGGDMVEYVYENEATFDELPYKFEGGTQNVEAAIGLNQAINYINKLGIEKIETIEKELTIYAIEKLEELSFITVYGTKDIRKKAGIISFNINGVHPHDAASIYDSYNIAIRAGNHCAQPLLRYMGLNSTCRISFYLYNTKEDIDIFIKATKRIYDMFNSKRGKLNGY